MNIQKNNTLPSVIKTYIQQEMLLKLDKSHLKLLVKSTTQNLKETYKSEYKQWKKEACLNPLDKTKINQVIDSILISTKSPWNPSLDLNDFQDLIFRTLRGNPPIKELFKQKGIVKTVLWKQNSELLKQARDLVQKIFYDLYNQVNFNSNNFHLEMIIGDLLSLYPFLSPNQDESIYVPLFIENRWQLNHYKIDKISLTPDWMGSPIVAFGLKPEKPKEFPPILCFKGTTYPADDGFLLSLIADLNPFASVGDLAFKLGQKKINNWLDKHTECYKAIIYGKSLGGAHGWKTAITFSKKVEKVMAYGAPGLSLKDQRKWRKVCENINHPKVTMFCQKNDSVPFYDRTGMKFNYYLVLSNKNRKGIAAHADMFSTHESSLIMQMNKKQIEAKCKRIKMAIISQLLSWFILPLLITAKVTLTFFENIYERIKKR